MLGYIAGFTSLLVGFSQPVAADAQLVGYYTTTLGLDVDFRIPTAIVIVLVTLLHAFDLRASRRGQNVLVAIKFALVLGFVAVGSDRRHERVADLAARGRAHGRAVRRRSSARSCSSRSATAAGTRRSTRARSSPSRAATCRAR